MDKYNKTLFQTINGEDKKYSKVHKRCLQHNGCIVDLGCLMWNWSKFFIGKKTVIGADPFEKRIENALFFEGLVSNFDGHINMKKKDFLASSDMFEEGGHKKEVLSWRSFVNKFRIEEISVLKMNIEGAEYDLLKSFTKEDFSKIDQIAVSFHEWLNPQWEKDTDECISILKENNFDILDLGQFGWRLCIKND